MITQSIGDVPGEFISMNKLFVEFPTMFHRPENVVFREFGFKAYFGRNEFYDATKGLTSIMPPHWGKPLTALMHLHITNKQLLEMTTEKKPHLELRVEVDPTIPPKQGVTTLRGCAERFNVKPEVIREFGFTHQRLNHLLGGGVWECIGMP